jgi:hypothetical protein
MIFVYLSSDFCEIRTSHKNRLKDTHNKQGNGLISDFISVDFRLPLMNTGPYSIKNRYIHVNNFILAMNSVCPSRTISHRLRDSVYCLVFELIFMEEIRDPLEF